MVILARTSGVRIRQSSFQIQHGWRNLAYCCERRISSAKDGDLSGLRGWQADVMGNRWRYGGEEKASYDHGTDIIPEGVNMVLRPAGASNAARPGERGGQTLRSGLQLAEECEATGAEFVSRSGT